MSYTTYDNWKATEPRDEGHAPEPEVLEPCASCHVDTPIEILDECEGVCLCCTEPPLVEAVNG